MANNAPMTVEEYCRRAYKNNLKKANDFAHGSDSRMYYMGQADAFNEILSMLKFLVVRK